MVRNIVRLCLLAGAFLLADYLVAGFAVDRFWPTAIVVAIVFSVLHLVVKPIIKMFALPITIVTLGLFTALLDVAIFWVLQYIPGVTITDMMAAIFAWLIVSFAGWIINAIFD